MLLPSHYVTNTLSRCHWKKRRCYALHCGIMHLSMHRSMTCTSQCIRGILAPCGQWRHGLTLVMPMTCIALCYASITKGMASGMVQVNIAGLSLVVLNSYQRVSLRHTHSVSVGMTIARRTRTGLSWRTVRFIRLTRVHLHDITRAEKCHNG
jgi:hypothetical protein